MQPSLSELSSALFGEPPKPKSKVLCENIFDVPRSSLLDVLEDLQNAFWSDELPEISSSSPFTTTTTIITSDTPADSLVENQTRSRHQDSFGKSQSHKRLRLTPGATHLRQQQNNSTFSASSTTGSGYDLQPTSPSPPSSPSRHIVPEPVYAKDINKALMTATTTHNSNTSGREDNLSAMNLWSVKWQIFKQLKSINHDYKEKQVIDLWQNFQRQGTKTEIQHMARYLLPVACSMRRWTVADAFRQVLIA